MAITPDNILFTLRSGAASTREIAERLGVNTSTISRHLARLGDTVLRSGNGPTTKWYALRSVPELQQSFVSIYRVTRAGSTERFATLYPVHPEQHYLVEYSRSASSTEWRCYESLPWWVNDMRPQGFLGRQFAQSLVSRGIAVATDPQQWREDDVLRVLTQEPLEAVGNLLIGQSAFNLWQASEPSQPIDEPKVAEQAEAIARGAHFDSSAQGEQPKLIANLAGNASIIKFSGARGNPVNLVAQRWSDLLHAEAHAAQAMNEVQPDIAADNRSFVVGERTFMQSVRFDRTNMNGRVGVVSLASLDLEFVGAATSNWPELIEQLEAQGVVTQQAVTNAMTAWAFGQLIANTDMHLGNLSVLHEGQRPYELAPVYDMLPMYFSPSAAGDLRDEAYQPESRDQVRPVHWEAAAKMAGLFWQRIAGDNRISDDFHALAEKQQAVVEQFIQTKF